MKSARAESVQIADSTADVDVDGMVRTEKVSRMEERFADALDVVVSDRRGEDRQEILDADCGGFHQGVVV